MRDQSCAELPADVDGVQRAAALISIAHPEDREQLERAAFERFKDFSLL